MTARIAQLTLDVDDVEVQARFWSEALGLTVETGTTARPSSARRADAPTDVPTIWLQPVAEASATSSGCTSTCDRTRGTSSTR